MHPLERCRVDVEAIERGQKTDDGYPAKGDRSSDGVARETQGSPQAPLVAPRDDEDEGVLEGYAREEEHGYYYEERQGQEHEDVEEVQQPEVAARGSDGLAAATKTAGTAKRDAVATRLMSVVAT